MFKVSLILIVCQFLSNFAFQFRFHQSYHFDTIICSTSKNIDDDKTSAAEQLRINAILKQQGITIDDIRKLKEAVASGSKYNKRENLPIQSKSLNVVDSASDLSSLESESSDVPVPVSKFAEQSSIKSNSIPTDSVSIPVISKQVSDEKSVHVNTSKELSVLKKISIRPKIKITKSSSTLSSQSTVDKSTSASNSRSEKSTSDAIADEFYNNPDSRNIRNKKVEPAVSLEGITLKKMVEDLVEEYGWVYLYEQTSLRCFQTNPTINSSLKVLRHDSSIWARKKIEYLYLDMRKESKVKSK